MLDGKQRAAAEHWSLDQRINFAERALQEVRWRAWADDVELFIRECVQITVVDGSSRTGRTPFHLYDYQLDALAQMRCNKFVLGLKARQLGFTTLGCAYSLWQLLFRPGGANVVFVSKDQSAADKNLAMVKAMYTHLPAWVKDRGPSFDGKAATKLVWTHDDGSLSQLKSFPPTDKAGAGESVTFLLLDEFDLYDRVSPAAVWSVVEPALMGAAANTSDPSVICFVISTARVPDGTFARMYREGKAGTGRFKALFVSAEQNRFLWTDGKFDPAKLAAKRTEFAALGQEFLIHREYPLTDQEAFLLSGSSRFTGLPDFDECVDFPLRGELVDAAASFDFTENEYGSLRVLEQPQADKFYVLSVDPAHGVGKDSTVAQVLTFDEQGDPRICAYWASNTMSQADAAAVVVGIGRWYHGVSDEALLVWDSTGGHAELLVHKWRDEYDYRNFYRYIPAAQARRRRPQAILGLNTAGVGGKRNLVLDTLQEMLPRLDGVYPVLREELGTFVVRENGRAEAERGCHDDHVMALAQGLWVLQDSQGAAVQLRTGSKDITAASESRIDIDRIFADAKQVQRVQEKADRRQWRRMSRATRRRTARL